MKKYVKPEMEIDIFDVEDVITTSGGDGAGTDETNDNGNTDDF